MTRLYIAGAMTGMPEMNYPAFNAEAARLRALGFHVENPAENPEQPDWQSYMRVGLAQLITCDEVAILPGWKQSKGATLEVQVAIGLGMPVREAERIVRAA